MKFTDGQWLMRKGVAAHYAAQAYEIEAKGHELHVLVPTRVIRHRGDTLGGPVLDLKLWSPTPDVIGVRVRHFEQSSSPQFGIFVGDPIANALADSDRGELCSGALRALRCPLSSLVRRHWRRR